MERKNLWKTHQGFENLQTGNAFCCAKLAYKIQAEIDQGSLMKSGISGIVCRDSRIACALTIFLSISLSSLGQDAKPGPKSSTPPPDPGSHPITEAAQPI